MLTSPGSAEIAAGSATADISLRRDLGFLTTGRMTVAHNVVEVSGCYPFMVPAHRQNGAASQHASEQPLCLMTLTLTPRQGTVQRLMPARRTPLLLARGSARSSSPTDRLRLTCCGEAAWANRAAPVSPRTTAGSPSRHGRTGTPESVVVINNARRLDRGPEATVREAVAGLFDGAPQTEEARRRNLTIRSGIGRS
jgi:hypothetical protein